MKLNIRADFERGLLSFTVRQKGYGRQGLYVSGCHLMDVFPNIEEHFNLAHKDSVFFGMKRQRFILTVMVMSLKNQAFTMT